MDRRYVSRVSMNVLRRKASTSLTRQLVLRNPGEHRCDTFERRARARELPPRTELVEEWVSNPENDIHRLIRIMPNYCDECVYACPSNWRYDWH